jgi:hypothetical protein
MRAFVVLLSVTLLSGCETVEIQYALPAPAGDFTAVEAQANENYQYFVLPRAYILVTPIAKSSSSGGVHTENGAQGSNGGGAAQQGAITPKSTSKKSAKPGSARAASDSQANGPDQQNASGRGNAAGGASSETASNIGVTTAIIDGRMWEAKVVLMPAEDRAFVVKGFSRFFMSTTLGVTKYANSDVVSSVSSTAENLVPKRLGQIASVLSSVVKIGAVLAVSGESNTAASLRPFVVEVQSKNQSAGVLNDGWTYSFKYDSLTPPEGTVTYRDFLTRSVGHKVSYWPTPACRSATLTIGRESNQTQSAFHVVVADPDVLRLQPLPVSGKVELGTVCGASVTGSQDSDALQSASDDLAALQAAIKTVKDAKSGDKAAPAAPASGGTATQKK